jgi:HEAT repeat protein
MMSDDVLAQYQDAVRKYREGASIEEIEDTLHALAEGQEPNTKLFLQELLNHDDWLTRSIVVGQLCFHYPDIDPDVIRQLEDMLLHDPSDYVRGFIPLALSGFVTWPNAALLSALQHDPDNQVRAIVIRTILELNDVSDKEAQKIYRIVREYDHLPTLQELRQLLDAHQLPSDFLRDM